MFEMGYMITYQKSNGDIFYRTRKVIGSMQIGDETSMGWKVLDIHEKYNGNWLHHEDVRRFQRKKLYKTPLKKRMIRALVRKLNKLA
jgi:hypothetical protein